MVDICPIKNIKPVFVKKKEGVQLHTNRVASNRFELARQEFRKRNTQMQ